MKAEHSEMTDGPTGWVPVALSADLPNSGVMRALIDGKQPLDLVVWRSTSGQVSAFDNRCPHRGMRLSFGFVRGERLSCIYHGWQYGEDGTCRHIPAHPDMTPPTSICANSYLCQDHDGVVWVSREEEDALDLPVFAGQHLRSLSVERNEMVLRGMLEAARVPISGKGKTETAEAFVVMENKTSLALQAGKNAATLRLIVHFQRITSEKTMLHVQTGPGLSVDQQISLSRWTERFRWSAENLGSMMNLKDVSAQEMHS